MFLKNVTYFIFILIGFIFLNSCKEKGCTDKDSLNYNVLAEEDDGSCLYCDSIQTFLDAKSQFLMDDYPSSTHYNQPIARFDLKQYSDTFNFTKCGTNGCKVTLMITSLINQKMNIDFRVTESSPGNFNLNSFLIIEAYDSVYMGIIGTQTNAVCYPLSSTAVTVDLDQPVIYY